MIRRFPVIVAGAVGLMLIACARPGASPVGDGVAVPPTATVATLPTAGMAACFDARRTPSARPSPPDSGPGGDGAGDAFARNQKANNAFRDRIELPAIYYAAAAPCVDKARAALEKLRGQNKYDAASVETALRSAGLADAYARKPGRLDLGSGTGVVFSATPGVGCIVGHHGPDDTTVEFGGGVKDGGCLVAPD